MTHESVYRGFIRHKLHEGADHGFDPLWMPDGMIANLEVAEREIKSGRSILNHVQADMFGDLDSEAA